MNTIIERITEAIKEILINFITSGMGDMFTEVNAKVGTVATQVGQTPQDWNAGIFSLIQSLSETVIVPIAGMIITFVLCYELITMVTQKNNFHEFETFNLFIWVFKAYIAIYLVTNTFNITMAVFDVGQHVVNSAAGVISGSTAIDATAAVELLLETMSVTISSNTTVYVRVTDSEGNIYEQNRSIRCYDTEKPTLSASLTDGVLTIQGQDTFSGISKITVNGAEYTELKDGILVIQMTQKDFTTKKIEITGTDGAGNVSDTYSLQNPYYEWAVKQAIAQQADSSGDMSTSSGGDQESEITSPLPQTATPSDPTESRGTVEDRTVTGIEQELAEKNETVDTISSTTTEGGKEFYTISTKSGKVFYLIIDNESTQDNVYFLTEVDNEDLMNFTLSDTATLPSVDTVYATVEDEPEPTIIPEPTTEAETEQLEQEVQMPGDSSQAGNYLMIGLLCAGAFAGAYYFKIYKPKHEDFDDEEYEEDYDDEEPEQKKIEYLDEDDEDTQGSWDYERREFLEDEEDV